MLPTPRPSLTNVYLIVAACTVAAILYTVAGRSPPPFVFLFISFAPIIAVGTWFQKYLRQSHVALPFDFGYLFMIGWLVLIPAMMKKLTIQHPWKFAAMLYALAIAPWLCAFAVGIVYSRIST